MNIYFSGIGGVGVGPLAMLAHDAGHDISGSDREKSPVYEDLAERGINLSTDQSGKFMREINEKGEIDLFVYTAALPDGHPELVVAREYGVTAVKRDELLNQLIEYKNLKLIAISGTHGKTTTTGMFIWTLKELGMPVSYSVGTRLSFGPAAKYEKDGEYFVYEADEFDKNMLKFKPFISVITSVDFDHPDTYRDEDDYRQAFQEFVGQSESSIAWADTELSGDNLDFVENISPVISLIGDHNKANGTLVFETLKKLFPEIDEAKVITAINSFPGTSRRFEELSPGLYSDYAHHPVEIASTIELAREINEKVVVVYQPHQNIRQHQLIKSGGYKDVFKGADKVYWIPTYLSREDKNLSVLSPEELIPDADTASSFVPSEMNDELSENIKTDISNGYLIVAMSAGDLDEWIRCLADSI